MNPPAVPAKCIHNLAWLSVREHPSSRKLCKPKNGAQIDGDHHFPILRGILGGGCATDDSGVVDDNVDRPEFGGHPFYQCCTRSGFRYIGGEIVCSEIKLTDLAADGPWIWIVPVA